MQCGEFQWPCASQTQCVPQSWRCDGTRDCRDQSDEAGCESEHSSQSSTPFINQYSSRVQIVCVLISYYLSCQLMSFQLNLLDSSSEWSC